MVGIKIKYTLVVIDMQDWFINSYKCLDNVIKNIEIAKENECDIILLKFGLCGEINNKILNCIKSYKNCIIIEKNTNSGGIEIKKTIKKYNFNKEMFYICGVNTCFCIKETIVELFKIYKYAKIKLLNDAIACDHEVSDCLFGFEKKIKLRLA